MRQDYYDCLKPSESQKNFFSAVKSGDLAKVTRISDKSISVRLHFTINNIDLYDKDKNCAAAGIIDINAIDPETNKNAWQLANDSGFDSISNYLEIQYPYIKKPPEPTTPTKPTTPPVSTTTPVPAIPGCKDKTQYSTMNNEEILKQAKSLPDSHPEKLDLINEIVKRNLTKQAEGYGFQIHDLGQAPVNQTTIVDWMKNRAHSLVNNASHLITHGTRYLTAITTSGAVCVTAVLQNQTSQPLHGGSTAGPNPIMLAGIIAGATVTGAAVVGGGAYCLYSKYQKNKNYQAALQNEQGVNSEKVPL